MTRLTRRTLIAATLASGITTRERSIVAQDILNRTPPPADDRVSYGNHPLQFADVRVPVGTGPHPCVIAIHGGFWRNRYTLDHLGHLCAALTAEGFLTWSLEYRRLGDPGGGWPGTFHDVAAGARQALDHAGSIGIDPARVAIIGHSAGGHLAAWLASLSNAPTGSELAARPLPLAGAVSLAGVLDLHAAWERNLGDGVVSGLLGGTPKDVPERYAAASPLALVPPAVPVVAIHGVDDTSVPFALSDSYVAAVREAGGEATLIALPGTGHFEPIDPESDAWPHVLAAVQEVLRQP